VEETEYPEKPLTCRKSLTNFITKCCIVTIIVRLQTNTIIVRYVLQTNTIIVRYVLQTNTIIVRYVLQTNTIIVRYGLQTNTIIVRYVVVHI
jgi:hypothetical protein